MDQVDLNDYDSVTITMDQVDLNDYDSVTIVVDQGPDGDHIAALMLQQLKTLCPQKKVEVQRFPPIVRRSDHGNFEEGRHTR